MKRIVLAGFGVIVIVIGIVVYAALFTIHQTEQALILQFGNPIRASKDPGLDYKLPFVQNVEFYDRRILDLDPPAQEIILSDQKRVNVDAFARYRIFDPLEFRKKAGTDANFRDVFGKRLNSAIRAEIGKILLADMLTEKRAAALASGAILPCFQLVPASAVLTAQTPSSVPIYSLRWVSFPLLMPILRRKHPSH